ncbi:Serine/arginine-rich splicing factor SC35 [Linum perenne]
MSHFGRSGPPDIADTYSLLVLNITFRTTADDLFPLFDKYGKVVDIFIPRDRRTGDSRGFAFVRYKYADEAQKAVERLDGRVVDGREITVQFAKYGPNAEKIQKGRIIEPVSRSRNGSRSCSPRRSPRRRYNKALFAGMISVIDIKFVFSFLIALLYLCWLISIGTEMTHTGIRTIGREAGAGVWTDVSVTDIVAKTENTTGEVGAAVSVLIMLEGGEEATMMISVEVPVDQSGVNMIKIFIAISTWLCLSDSGVLISFLCFCINSRSPRRRSPVPRRSVSPQKVSPKDEILDRRNQDARSRSPRSISPQDRPIASRSPSPRNSDAEVSG